MLTEAQVAAAKSWRPVIDWRTVDFHRGVADAPGVGTEYRFAGGILDGETRTLLSPAPGRFVLHGDRRRKPTAWTGKATAIAGTADIYDLKDGVYVFVRTAKRGGS